MKVLKTIGVFVLGYLLGLGIATSIVMAQSWWYDKTDRDSKDAQDAFMWQQDNQRKLDQYRYQYEHRDPC